MKNTALFTKALLAALVVSMTSATIENGLKYSIRHDGHDSPDQPGLFEYREVPIHHTGSQHPDHIDHESREYHKEHEFHADLADYSQHA